LNPWELGPPGFWMLPFSCWGLLFKSSWLKWCNENRREKKGFWGSLKKVHNITCTTAN
jgi:hypothetical protein